MTLQINFLDSRLGLPARKIWGRQWQARGALSPWYFQNGKAVPGHVEPKYAQGPLLDPQQRCSTGKIQQIINRSQTVDKNVDHFAWKFTFLLKYNCASLENLAWRKKITEYVWVRHKNTVVRLFQYLAQETTFILLASVIGSGQRQTLVNAVMNLRFPQNAGKFLASWLPVSLWRRAEIRGVSK